MVTSFYSLIRYSSFFFGFLALGGCLSEAPLDGTSPRRPSPEESSAEASKASDTGSKQDSLPPRDPFEGPPPLPPALASLSHAGAAQTPVTEEQTQAALAYLESQERELFHALHQEADFITKSLFKDKTTTSPRRIHQKIYHTEAWIQLNLLRPMLWKACLWCNQKFEQINIELISTNSKIPREAFCATLKQSLENKQLRNVLFSSTAPEIPRVREDEEPAEKSYVFLSTQEILVARREVQTAFTNFLNYQTNNTTKLLQITGDLENLMFEEALQDPFLNIYQKITELHTEIKKLDQKQTRNEYLFLMHWMHLSQKLAPYYYFDSQKNPLLSSLNKESILLVNTHFYKKHSSLMNNIDIIKSIIRYSLPDEKTETVTQKKLAEQLEKSKKAVQELGIILRKSIQIINQDIWESSSVFTQKKKQYYDEHLSPLLNL